MKTRTLKERVVQTLWYEAVGIAVFTPLLYLCTDTTLGDSLGVIAALSLCALTVTGLFNWAFDNIEAKVCKRAASDRPFWPRVFHAVSLEFAIVVATLPAIKYISGVSWTEAAFVDIALLLAYIAYGFFFFQVYDRVRPVDGSQVA